MTCARHWSPTPRHSTAGRTSHHWLATNSSAGWKTRSEKGPGNAASAAPRRNWRKGVAGRAAGRVVDTASAPAGSRARGREDRINRSRARRPRTRSTGPRPPRRPRKAAGSYSIPSWTVSAIWSPVVCPASGSALSKSADTPAAVMSSPSMTTWSLVVATPTSASWSAASQREVAGPSVSSPAVMKIGGPAHREIVRMLIPSVARSPLRTGRIRRRTERRILAGD